ncbi:MAG: flagellar motor protein MotB [Planctomycetota bacterium]
MAKKHKHEEHVNHERWVISFADMMTLLFALFVVLYAMGVQDLEKLKKLKKSIQFAFNIAGSGKTQDAGIFDKDNSGGEVMMPAPLVTAQDGAMREFLKEELEDFEEALGNSLEIVMTDDSVSMKAPLSDFFEPGRAYPIKSTVQSLLDRTIDGSLSFTSDIRISIEAPDLPIARTPDGRVVSSTDLCYQRLRTLGRIVRSNPRVRPSMVGHEFRQQNERAGRRGSWESQAVVIIVFSNTRAENR